MIGRTWRRHALYRHEAAIRIQAAARGFLARRRRERLTLEIASATVIQAGVRVRNNAHREAALRVEKKDGINEHVPFVAL